jgi:hypothetical protein
METITGPNATITIEDVPYEISTSAIETVRPDVFRPGSFSVFDILVYLHEKGDIDLEYHYNASLRTHRIELLNNETDWWYYITYSGGWFEQSVFRMDLYPWKEGSTINYRRIDKERIDRIHRAYEQEVNRLLENNGQVVIPEVIIELETRMYEFSNVSVTAHNLRNDSLQNGVITAIDVIMSLGDERLISYGLGWYESIGTADIVRSYWVEGINGKYSIGTCGYVYESGPNEFSGVHGNHIHLPSDMRVLTSPEYSLWFWICL